jgi:DNA-directed RNA polymerase subunit D
MKIKVLESKPTYMKFIVEETDPATANALRRTLVADIPKMAIEDVEFHLGPIRGEDGKEYESVAPLFDEIIAHRLGLVPLPTDLKLFVRKSECKACNGEGCPSCTIIYSLNKKGPCTVTSGDLEPIGDVKLKPIDPNIPIVKLGEGQAMLVYATAVLGTAKEHAKWQVTAGVGYKYYPVVDIDNRKMTPAKAPVEVCPVKILHVRDKKVVVEEEEKCTLCMTCVEKFDPGSINVHGDPSRMIFHFETDGSMSANEALNTALDLLDKRFTDIAAKSDALAAGS